MLGSPATGYWLFRCTTGWPKPTPHFKVNHYSDHWQVLTWWPAFYWWEIEAQGGHTVRDPALLRELVSTLTLLGGCGQSRKGFQGEPNSQPSLCCLCLQVRRFPSLPWWTVGRRDSEGCEHLFAPVENWITYSFQVGDRQGDDLLYLSTFSSTMDVLERLLSLEVNKDVSRKGLSMLWETQQPTYKN